MVVLLAAMALMVMGKKAVVAAEPLGMLVMAVQAEAQMPLVLVALEAVEEEAQVARKVPFYAGMLAVRAVAVSVFWGKALAALAVWQRLIMQIFMDLVALVAVALVALTVLLLRTLDITHKERIALRRHMAVVVDQEEFMLLVEHSTVKAAVMAQFVLFGPELLVSFLQQIQAIYK